MSIYKQWKKIIKEEDKLAKIDRDNLKESFKSYKKNGSEENRNKFMAAYEEYFENTPSDDKNFTTFATSSAVPILFNGIVLLISSLISSFKTSVILVSINPGATAFTSMFLLATSFAKLLVNPIIPALDAA